MQSGRRAVGDVGKGLLEEVAEENFAEFLSSLRSAAVSISASASFSASSAPLPLPPHYPFINIPSLDRLLLPLFYYHHQKYPYPPQNRQLFPENNASTNFAAFPLPFVELASTSPCAGKTQLLYLICTVSVLPSKYEIASSPTSTPITLSINGKNGSIVVFDSDNRFSISRLCMTMRHYLFSYLGETSTPSVHLPWMEGLILTCLKHIHVFRPMKSTRQLISTLETLPGYLCGQGDQNRHLAGILIDSISTFYWEDRAGDSVPTTGSLDDQLSQHLPSIPVSNTYSNPMMTLAAAHQPLIAQLHALQKLFGCFVVVTRRIYMVKGRDEQMVLQNPLPGVVTAAITMRLLITREQRGQAQELIQSRSSGQAWFRGSVEMVGGMWGGREGLNVLKKEARGQTDPEFPGIRFRVGTSGIEIVSD